MTQLATDVVFRSTRPRPPAPGLNAPFKPLKLPTSSDPLLPACENAPKAQRLPSGLDARATVEIHSTLPRTKARTYVCCANHALCRACHRRLAGDGSNTGPQVLEVPKSLGRSVLRYVAVRNRRSVLNAVRFELLSRFSRFDCFKLHG